MEEEQEKKKSEEETKSPKESKAKGKKPKIEKEIYWIVGFMIGLIILFLIASAVFKELKKFDYQGLTFTKEKYGTIPFYNYYYTFTDANGLAKAYSMNIRTDPRENNVSFNADIKFQQLKPVYLSIDETDLIQCEQSRPAVANLASFFQGNEISIIPAIPNRNKAEEREVAYANCENRPGSTVVQIQKGEETKITQINNCYLIEIANCEEMTPALEKFMVETLVQARARGTFYV